MKTKKRYLLRVLPVLLVAAVMMVSCSSGSEEATIIPKNATLVGHIDMASIWKKADLANAENLQMVKSMREALQSEMPEMDQMVEAMMKDPSSCGLDFSRPVAFFVTTGNTTNDETIVFAAAMKSRKDFTRFLLELEENAGLDIDVEEQENQTVVELSMRSLLLFNDKWAFVDMSRSLAKTDDEMVDYLNSLLALKPEESMAKDADFKKYLAEREDISVFVNYETLTNWNANGNPATQSAYRSAGIGGLVDQLKDMKICLYGSFDKGTMTLRSMTLNVPEAFKGMVNKKFNTDLMGYMPAETLVAMSYVINLENTVKTLFEDDNDVNLDEKVGIDDYTVRDVINAFGGSLVADFYGMRDGVPYFAVAFDIKDADLVRSLLDEMAVQNGDIYTIDIAPLAFYLNNDVLLMSTDPAVIDNARMGGKSNGLMTVADKASKGNYFYMNLDLQAWPDELLSLAGLYDNPLAEIILSMFDHAEAQSSTPTEGHFTLFMADKEQNSLAYILQEVDKMN